MKQHIGYAVLFSLGFYTLTAQQGTQAAIPFYLQHMLNNFTAAATDTQIPRATKESLSEYDKHLITFSLFSEQIATSPVRLSEQVASDLTLFFYDKDFPDYNLLSHIYRGHTLFGKVVLATRLVNPHTDVRLLDAEQQRVRWLLEHPEEMAALNTLFATLASQEEMILELFNPRNGVYNKDKHRLITGKKKDISTWATETKNLFGLFQTKTPWMLEFNRLYEHLQPLSGLQNWGLGIAVVYAYLRMIIMYSQRASEKMRQHREQMQARVPENLRQAAQERMAAIQKETECIRKKLFKAFAVISAIIIPLFAVYKKKELANDTANRKNFVQMLRAFFVQTQKFNTSLLTIETELTHLFSQPNAPATTLFPELAQFSSLLSTPQLQSFMVSLQQPTFTDENYFFSRVGLIIHALAHFTTLPRTFGSLLHSLGSIEATLSTANLMRSTQQTNVHFCFPHYIEQPAPLINAHNFWYAGLKPASAKTNSVTLGNAREALNDDQAEDNPLNILITGPNTGGKSTLIRAVLSGALLAQTLCITPADRMDITPFSIYNTSLKAVDKVGEGKSLFHAELDRANALLQKNAQAQPGEKILNGIDEIFSATSPSQGEACSLAFAQLLVKNKYSSSIIATHFPKLTSLPRHTNNAIENYKVIAHKHPDGSISLPYRLEKGRSTQSVVLEMLRRDGFNPKFIDRAQAFIRKHHPEYDKF